MYKLSRLQIILFFFSFVVSGLMGQSNPHGMDLKIDCKQCHTSGSWKMATMDVKFDHFKETGFELEGQHNKLECKRCHQDLSFKGLGNQCVDCHKDVHQMSVGNDCKRCHTSENWFVQNIADIHSENGFLLEGAHVTVSCIDCHKNNNSQIWNRLISQCISCHQTDYKNTQNPNHQLAGYSTDCIECHSPQSPVWKSEFFHYFFPLTQGHNGLTCVQCHQNKPFQQASSECISCHQNDYNNASNPNHKQSGFPTDCAKCHTTQVGWAPAKYDDHDADFFPIYSGNHKGAWTKCTDCHTNSNNFASFSCIDCHEHNNQADLADEHNDVRGYSFQSKACFECHPKGSE